MNRRNIVNCLDRAPRLWRHNRGIYSEDEIEYSLNGGVNDSRTYLVSENEEQSNFWWNDHIIVLIKEDGSIFIDDEGIGFTKEKLFNMIPNDVKEELLFDLDAFA